MPSKRVLITGATGFVGARFVAQAIERGWEVIALLTPEDGGSRLGDLLGRVRVVRGTLADPGAWGAEVASLAPDACLHLAWNTVPGVYLDTRENLDWLTWSGQLFARLPEWGCRRIVGVGTCAEYDADAGTLREDTPLRPLTLYAATKAALSLVGQQLAAQRAGVGFAWARIFFLYGPGEHPQRLIASCIRALLAGQTFEATAGTQVRDFLHVDDVAAGLLAVLESDAQGAVNVCSGQGVEVRRILELIGQATGRADLLKIGARPARGWDPPYIRGDNEKLRGLGWRARYSLAGGIADAVAQRKRDGNPS